MLARATLVLADPPYGGADARALLERLGKPGVLTAGARVVLETHAKDVVPEVEGALARTSQRRYGETVVHVYTATMARGGPASAAPRAESGGS